MRIATASHGHRISLLLAVVLITALIGAPASGAPSTATIRAKQAEAAAAQAQLSTMNAELEVRVEEYNAITEAVDQTRQEIATVRAELEQAKEQLAAAQDTLARRATSIYKDRGTNVLDVFLGARSFRDFVARVELAARITRSDAVMVADVKEAKARVEEAEQALEQREAEQVALQNEAAARAAAIEADIAAQQRFVNSLNGEVKALIAAEEARLAAEAAARARQAAEAARRAGSGRQAADAGSLGSPHPEVVDVALEYVGVPYVWGGSTPAGFDCSGLTQYSYREIGITLPRTSASQYNAGQHIAPDRLDLLQPGDLVFFGTNGDPDQVHHVGIYVGSGNYLHAPYTGALVRVDSLTARISSRSDYVGASRL